MAKIAFVFPGQGAQKVGMGRAAFDAWSTAKQVFEQADAALDFSLSALCFDGPEEQLKLTANTQPAILTTSVALLSALDARPDVVAGHSLGEYAANVCAGTVSLEDAVRLVRQRGLFMQEAVPVGAGAMAAVIFRDEEEVVRICGACEGVVEPVNFNSPGQIVIAGAADAVARASEQLREAGAKVIDLPVSAPFHSSLMRPAEERLEPHLAQTPFAEPSVPIVTNVDAEAVCTAEQARDALRRQVSRPVKWQQSIKAMIDDGVSLFVEIGPGRVLSGLIARISRTVGRVSLGEPDDLEKVQQAIAEVRGG